MAAVLGGAAAAGAAACADVNTNPQSVAALALDSVPALAVVAGDSLRDSLGVARPLRATVFNPRGDPLTGVAVRYRAADPGLTVDSVTGFVVADTARATPVRVVAQVRAIQTPPVPIYVVVAPDTVLATAPRDTTFGYSLRDTAIFSPAVSVRVVRAAGLATPRAVPGWFVSYALVYPADSTVASLVSDAGAGRSRLDTTGTDGAAARRVRISTPRLATATDTVVVLATVLDRGRRVPGSPVRFRLRLAPAAP